MKEFLIKTVEYMAKNEWIVGWAGFVLALIIALISVRSHYQKKAVAATIADEDEARLSNLANNFTVSLHVEKISKSFLETFVEIEEIASKRNKIKCEITLYNHSRNNAHSEDFTFEEEIEVEPNRIKSISLGRFYIVMGTPKDIKATVKLKSLEGETFLEKELSHPFRASM